MVVILWEFKSPRPHQEPPSHVLGPWRLYYKRLERGRFRLFQIPMGASSVAMDATELAMLLDGIDVGKVRRPARWTPPTPNWRRSIGRSLARRARRCRRWTARSERSGRQTRRSRRNAGARTPRYRDNPMLAEGSGCVYLHSAREASFSASEGVSELLRRACTPEQGMLARASILAEGDSGVEPKRGGTSATC